MHRLRGELTIRYAPDGIGQANEVLIRLARLIGRQIARETFERDLRRTRAEENDGRPSSGGAGRSKAASERAD